MDFEALIFNGQDMRSYCTGQVVKVEHLWSTRGDTRRGDSHSKRAQEDLQQALGPRLSAAQVKHRRGDTPRGTQKHKCTCTYFLNYRKG